MKSLARRVTIALIGGGSVVACSQMDDEEPLGTIAAGLVCAVDSDCATSNLCVTATCDRNTLTCAYANTSSACNDGNACTTGDVCMSGACIGGSAAAGCGRCAAAATLPPEGGTFSGTTQGTSSFKGVCDDSAGTGSGERVYAWTPSRSGTAELATCGGATNYDSVVYIMSGPCSSSAPQLACNDDTVGCSTSSGSANASRQGSRLSVQVAAGTTYYVVVDGWGTSRGNYTLKVTPPIAAPPPPAPTVIPAAGGTLTGATSGASSYSAACAAGPTSSAPERIFQWTPSASGTATLQTCGSQGTFDTVLYVRSSLGGSDLACNDDTAGCAIAGGSPNAGQGSRVSLAVTAGTTYYVVVDGYQASGQFVLSITPPTGSPPPPPPAPVVIPAGGGTVSGTTSGTSGSSGTCASEATSAAPERIFQWTPTRTGSATLETCSARTTFDTVLYVRGSSGTSQLACNDDTTGCAIAGSSPDAGRQGSRVSVFVTAGTTYQIVVDGYQASGQFDLTVRQPPPGPPDSDDPYGTPGTIQLTGGKLHIMPLGDSITEGPQGGYRNDLYTGLTGRSFVVDMVGTRYDISTVIEDKDHEGHPGYTILNARNDVDGWLSTITTPNVVLVMLGTNDLAWWTNVYPEETKDRMVAFVDHLRVKLPTAVIIVATIPPQSSENVEPLDMDRAVMTEQFNGLMKGALQARPDHGTKVFVADVNAVLTLDDLYDGIHPDREAHSKIASVFYDVMADLLP